MPFEQQLLLGVVIPAAVAILAMAVGVWGYGPWAGAIGVGLGYISGHLFIRGLPPVPPIDVVDCLPILAALAMAVGLVDTSKRIPKLGRQFLGLATAAATALLITRPMIANVWPTGEAVAWLAGLIVGMAAIGFIVDTTASRDPGPMVPFALGLVTAGLAVVQGLSSSIVLARLSGATAITIAPLAFVAWRRPREGLVRVALPVIMVLFYGTLMAGFFYSEVPRGSALVLALSPLSAVFSLVGKRRWIRATLAIAVAVSCVGASVGIAIATATPEPATDEY